MTEQQTLIARTAPTTASFSRGPAVAAGGPGAIAQFAGMAAFGIAAGVLLVGLVIAML